jgi:HAMP domain-containing protein
MRRHFGLRQKLVLGFGLSSVLVGGLTFLAVRERVLLSAGRAAESNLAATGRAFVNLMATQFLHLEAASRLIADTPRLKAAVETRDPGTVQEEVGFFRESGQVDLLLVVDAGRRPMAFVCAQCGMPATVADVRGIRPATPGPPRRELMVYHGKLYFTVSCALETSEKQPPTLLVGKVVDAGLAEQLHGLAQVDVAFLSDGAVKAASFDREDLLAATRQLACQAEPGRSRRIVVGGRPFQWLVDRLAVGTGTPLTYVLALDLTPRDREGLEIESAMLLGGSVFLLVITLVSSVLAGRVTRGVQTLVEAANQMAQGNYEAPIEVVTGDEVSYLADIMRELRNSVWSQIHKLTRINESLRGKLEEIVFNESMGLHYTDVEVLGRGGMGIVYKATNTETGRVVAIKVLSPLMADSTHLVNRFLRECEILGRLDHPGVVKIYQAGRGLLPYCEMEYFAGMSLQARVAESGPLPWDQVLPFMDQVLAALECIHLQGVVHRDLKPANVLVNDAGEIRLVDFGLALDKTMTSVTVSGEIFGTLDYMAPEQEVGDEVDGRADIYSAALLCRYLLTGRSLRVRTDGYLPLSKCEHVVGAVPVELDAVLEMAIRREPDERWCSAAKFAAALHDASARRSPGL